MVETKLNINRILRRLQMAAVIQSLDRFSIAPMLMTIAGDLQTSLPQVAIARPFTTWSTDSSSLSGEPCQIAWDVCGLSG